MFSLVNTNVVVESIFNQTLEDNRDWYAEEEYKDDEILYRTTPLRGVWLDEDNFQQMKEKI